MPVIFIASSSLEAPFYTTSLSLLHIQLKRHPYIVMSMHKPDFQVVLALAMPHTLKAEHRLKQSHLGFKLSRTVRSYYSITINHRQQMLWNDKMFVPFNNFIVALNEGTTLLLISHLLFFLSKNIVLHAGPLINFKVQHWRMSYLNSAISITVVITLWSKHTLEHGLLSTIWVPEPCPYLGALHMT